MYMFVIVDVVLVLGFDIKDHCRCFSLSGKSVIVST
jgi:hypothetical protein